MQVRAVFTDIDGVFHPSVDICGLDMASLSFGGSSAFAEHGLFRWCQDLENVLAEVAPDALVVVHSSWRKQVWATDRIVRGALGPLGHRYQGMTSPELPRETSIIDLCQRAGIDDYIILDDARDEFARDNSRLILTNPLKGVSEQQVLDRVRAWALRQAPSATERLAGATAS